MKNVFKSLIVATLVVFTLYSCAEDDASSSDSKGTVNVKLTDGPFPFDFVSEANVSITKVELQNENGEFVTLFDGNSSYNMVTLTNGVTADIKLQDIEIGVYSQVRITTQDSSVKLSNGNTLEASGTSKTKTVDINPELVVEEGTTSDILLDLDLNGSFSFFGELNALLGGWISDLSFINTCDFDPQFRACDFNQTGEIAGTIKVDGSFYENAELSIEVDGETISTHSEADGSFKFIGVQDGTYTVSATTKDGGSVEVGDVVVSGTNTANCELVIN